MRILQARMRSKLMLATVLCSTAMAGTAAYANCSSFVYGRDPSAVQAALASAVTQVAGYGAGLGNAMWATVVDAQGVVCLVVNSGGGAGAVESIWLGSRVISAQKASTANAFSLSSGSSGTAIALSTANLYTAVQPGGSLFGLQASNPVDAGAAYAGASYNYGNGVADPMAGQVIGGVNVFGGGLAIYSSTGVRLGAIGVSGDTSCTDHAVAWVTRHALGLDYVPGGVSPNGDDNIIYDITPQAGQMPGVSAGGFGHPHCLHPTAESAVLAALPAVRKIAK
jgi:uncharacterized protein GlcG (DUF336 family)